MPRGRRATRLFVAGGDAKRTRGVTMTPQEPYLAPRACRFDDKRGYVKVEREGRGCRADGRLRRGVPAPELVSEAEGPVPVPAPAEGRLGYRFVKRAFDIAFSLCAIAVLLVPSIILCVAIRLESPGCPIYSQKRVGAHRGRSGEARTSTCTSSGACTRTPTSAVRAPGTQRGRRPPVQDQGRPARTRIGKFIRKHSIDELPQS